MPPSQDRTIPERLAAIEVKVLMLCNTFNSMDTKLDAIVPAVKENSWWIEKIKWGFVFVTIVAVVGGIVTLAIRS